MFWKDRKIRRLERAALDAHTRITKIEKSHKKLLDTVYRIQERITKQEVKQNAFTKDVENLRTELSKEFVLNTGSSENE